MEILSMIFYSVITLGILIFVHELGHFLAAKFSGMRVDRFSIGFPPRAFGKKIGDTDYCVSWIPVGGYVKIAGMVDESFDTAYVDQPPQPWEFRAKSFPAKIFVICAGVIMNLLLAVAIFWGINYVQGRALKATTEVGYVVEGSTAARHDLRPGDKIIAVNGTTVRYWEEIQNLVMVEHAGNDLVIDLDREGRGVTVKIPGIDMPGLSGSPEQQFGIIEAQTAAVIADVVPGKPADKLGLKAGDVIFSLNDTAVTNQYQIYRMIQGSVGKSLHIIWKRGDEVFSGSTQADANGRIGILPGRRFLGKVEHLDYTLLEAFPQGLKDIMQATGIFFRSIEQLIAGRTTFKESFGGPIAIAQLATQSAEYGLLSYLGFMALLSMSLAILNILPIPALDGGHLIILVIEWIIRREIPHKVKITIQQVGFILLLAFMAFVIYNDISRF